MGQSDCDMVDAQDQGLHRNDFILAARTDQLYASMANDELCDGKDWS